MAAEDSEPEGEFVASTDSQEQENLHHIPTRAVGGTAIPVNATTDGYGEWEDIDALAMSSALRRPPASGEVEKGSLQILSDIDRTGQYKVPLVPQHDLPRQPAPQAPVPESSVLINAITKEILDQYYAAQFLRLDRELACKEVPDADQVSMLAQIDTAAGTSMNFVATFASLDVPKPDISPASPIDMPSPIVVVPGLEIIDNRREKRAAAEKDGEGATVDQTKPDQKRPAVESLSQASSSADSSD